MLYTYYGCATILFLSLYESLSSILFVVITKSCNMLAPNGDWNVSYGLSNLRRMFG